jgi:putative ABC transport system permease protein
MIHLLRHLIWPEWRAHPWRQALAVLAVALGVALAWSVHLINGSALAEFAGAVRAVQGEPDASLVCDAREGCDDARVDTLAARPEVTLALPVVEIDSYALPDGATQRVALRIVGTDALQVWRLAPSLAPRAAAGESALASLDPNALFLNGAAFERLGVAEGDRLAVQHGAGTVALRVAGRIAAGGPPLALIDIAGAQHHFGFAGKLSRIDLRLAAGADAQALDFGAPWRLARPDEREQRVSNVSRAYRVNLTVLALVALFVGAFLVFAVLALSVAQRVPSLALLGVLGLSARERAALLRAECALLGVAGSVLGLALGTALAQAALRWLAGDLGGGYFPGTQPALQFSWPGALLFGLLGVAAAMVGGWLPARQAGALAPAQALKGLGGAPLERHGRWSGPLLLAVGTALAFTPPIGGLPIGAYLSVALLLVGGIACVPLLIDALLAHAPSPRAPLPLLALKRAHHERDAASVAVAGVVASLALAVAITAMVASFREGVSRWLEDVLPADIYLRTASNSSAADQAFLPPGFAEAAARLPGVARVEASRVRSLLLAPTRPAVTLLARPNVRDGAEALPLVGDALPAHPTLPGVFVSEAVERLYDVRPGSTLQLPLGERALAVHVRGVWRDYARQFGAVMIDAEDYRRVTGDMRQNDLALWVTPGVRADEVLAGVRALAGRDAPLFEIATTAQLRVLSLAIFDRSFAVTRYLQAVAIGIGLAGIAASFSAQVWARRREFGLLAHLGFTRAQTIALVAGEGTVWTAAGALVGLALGLAVAVVLVHVVNPQSFHWTMDLLVPWGRIAALMAAVLAAGAATAAISARAAAGRRFGDMVAAVKEDW